MTSHPGFDPPNQTLRPHSALQNIFLENHKLSVRCCQSAGYLAGQRGDVAPPPGLVNWRTRRVHQWPALRPPRQRDRDP